MCSIQPHKNQPNENTDNVPMKKLILLFLMEDFPTQACSSSGFPSLLQLKFFVQTHNQTGSYSVEYLPLVAIAEATTKEQLQISEISWGKYHINKTKWPKKAYLTM